MKVPVIISFVLCLYACRRSNPEVRTDQPIPKDSLRATLMSVDKSWSDSSLKKGYYHSRLDFAADDAVELLQGSMPLKGKAKITAYTAEHPDTGFTLQWHPVKAEVSNSGELGYTFGGWTMRTRTKAGKDTTLYGDYLTVWQQQPDGSWKFIADGGNDTPDEVH